MTTYSDIPQVGTLNPAQPDYVARLDSGFNVIKGLAEEVNQQLRRVGNGLVSRLQGQGIDVVLNLKVDDVRGIEWHFKEHPIGQAEERRLSDVAREYRRKNQDKLHLIADRGIALVRAEKDFYSALVRQTKIESLTEDTAPPRAFFYLLLNGEVYGALVDPRSEKILEPEKIKGVATFEFANPKFLEALREQAGEYEARAYVVRNPSSVLTPSDVFHYLIAKELEFHAKKLDELTKIPVSENPIVGGVYAVEELVQRAGLERKHQEQPKPRKRWKFQSPLVHR